VLEGRKHLWLAALLLLTLVLQGAAATQKSFWEDEAFTAMVIQSSPGEVIRRMARDNHPPLYFVGAHFGARLFGDSEPGVRLLSVLFAVLTVLLVYRLAADLFDARTGLTAATLLALSPLFLTYAHNARYYSLSAFLSLGAALATYHYHRTRRLLFLALYILAGVALLYSAYTTAAILLACFVWGVAQWRSQRDSFGQLALWTVAQLGAPLLFLPWLVTFQSVIARNADSAPAFSLMEVAKRVGYLGYGYSVGETLSPINPIALLGIFLTIALLTIALLRGGRRFTVWLPILFIAIVGATSIIINMVTLYPQNAFQALPYRTLYLFPFFVMLLAYGVSQLRGRTALVVVGLLLAVYGAGIFNYFTNREFMRPFLAVPWNRIFSTIQAEAAPDALVVCSIGDDTCMYYIERYGFEPRTSLEALELAERNPSEVWWIQSNLGRRTPNMERESDILETIRGQYQNSEVTNYAPHDASVRRVKAALSPQESYEYRVSLYRLTQPVE
jgi:uncharacterized membrane protein